MFDEASKVFDLSYAFHRKCFILIFDQALCRKLYMSIVARVERGQNGGRGGSAGRARFWALFTATPINTRPYN